MAEVPTTATLTIVSTLFVNLPAFHADGDGGFEIPFVMPQPGGRQNDRAKFRVAPTPWGWRAALTNCYDHAENAAQARAFAAAWLRCAELLDAVGASEPPVPGVADGVNLGSDGSLNGC